MKVFVVMCDDKVAGVMVCRPSEASTEYVLRDILESLLDAEIGPLHIELETDAHDPNRRATIEVEDYGTMEVELIQTHLS